VRAFRVRLDPQPMVPGNFGQADRTRALLAAAGALLIVLATSAIYYLGREAQSTNAPSGRDPQVPSIAVLPFLNLSGDSEQEYFVDGLTEDLITDLSNLSGLLVIARNSSFTYKNQVVKAQQVAKELHVAYVLNGSVRRAAGRVRITAELTDAASKRQILAQRYDRELTDIFAVQDEVKKEIVSALAVKLEPSEQSRTVVKPTNSIEAYERIVSDP